MWKDHQTAQLVNELRDCATKYHAAGQLRERIAYVVAPMCRDLAAAQQEIARLRAALERIAADSLDAWARSHAVGTLK